MERGEKRGNESRPRDQQEDLWDGGGGAQEGIQKYG